MPELDGVTIFAFASFAALVFGWLVAPADAIARVDFADSTLVTEAAAA